MKAGLILSPIFQSEKIIEKCNLSNFSDAIKVKQWKVPETYNTDTMILSFESKNKEGGEDNW